MKIEINVTDEAELYNGFDKEGKTLSDGVISYIKDKSALMPVTERIEIELASNAPLDREKFIAAFGRFVQNEGVLLEKEKKLNAVRQVWLMVIGVIFIGLSVSLSFLFNNIALQIISTIGSFALWEAAGSWLLRRKEINLNKRKLTRLSVDDVIFNDGGADVSAER